MRRGVFSLRLALPSRLPLGGLGGSAPARALPRCSNRYERSRKHSTLEI